MSIPKKTEFGSELSLKAIFDAYYHRLCFYAAKYLGDTEKAKDIVQEILVELWEREHEFKNEHALSAWLYTAVYHACMNRLHLDSIHTKHHRRILEQSSPMDTNNYVTDRIENEILFEIFMAIDQLPAECRKIFKMSYMDGYSIQEIADKLEISVHTVKSQRARAKKLLQEQLKDLFSLFVLLFFR